MRSFTLASLATAVAATTQIPFFVPGMGANGSGGVDPVASIVRADATTTVMALACPTGTEDTECGWGQNDLTISVIASTIYAVSVPAAQVSFDCTSKKDMTCTAAVAVETGTDSNDFLDGFTAGSDGMATGTTVYPSESVVFQTATVTKGGEKLSGGDAAVEGEASVTAKETAAKETGASSTLKTSGLAASTGASPSSTGASPTGTSAAPQQATGAASRFGVEGAALFALVGVAAVHVL